MLTIKQCIDTNNYSIGVIIARFQSHELHVGHIKLIEMVMKNHSKVIIFLGIPVVERTKKNPLSFESRKQMVEGHFPFNPNLSILPLKDHRSDKKWSENIDSLIVETYGAKLALLYGSRDSFISAYSGEHQTVDVESSIIASATELRNQVAKEITDSKDFRAGIIHATQNKWDVTYPTVDVVAMNDKNQILLARKPNEHRLRFVGGFVDRSDSNYEEAAIREFKEETGGLICGLKYIASQKVNDWRYRGLSDGIMTTLFLGEFVSQIGINVTAQDDIESLSWVNPHNINIEKDIMKEHQSLMFKLLQHILHIDNKKIK